LPDPARPDPHHRWPAVLWLLLGAAVGWSFAASLAAVSATVFAALLLCAVASFAGSVMLTPWQRRLLVGLLAGVMTGTAYSLAERVHELSPAAHGGSRLAMLLALGLAGLFGGLRLGRDARQPERRHPRDLLRSASALTTGLFALMVTLAFLHLGLEGARAFSSRLSTTLTIVVTAVVLPGWLAQQLLQAPRPRLTPPPSSRP
jgi:hypothetical protein